MDSQQNQNLRGAGGNSLPTSATRPEPATERYAYDERGRLQDGATYAEDAYASEGESAQDIPNPKQENKIREINISQLSRGFVVRVGCQNFAFSTKEELIGKLAEYINEPNKSEEKWNRGDLFLR